MAGRDPGRGPGLRWHRSTRRLGHAALLALAALSTPAATHAQDPQQPAWSERRGEVAALDFKAQDDATLGDLLESFAPIAGPTDAFAAFAAGKAAYVLGERLRNRGDFAGSLAIVHDGIEACREPGGMRPYLLHLAADLTAYSRDFDGTLILLDQAEAALDQAQRETGIACSIQALRGEVLRQMGLPDQAAPLILGAVECAQALRDALRLDAGALLDALTKRASLRIATESYDLLLEEVSPILADHELLAGRSAARARLSLRLGLAHLWFARGEGEHATRARSMFEAALAEPDLLELDRLTCRARLAQLALLVGDLGRAETELALALDLVAAMAGREGFRFPPIEVAFLAALDARLTRLAQPDDVVALRERRDALASAFDALVLGWRESPEREGGLGLLRHARTQLVLGELIEAELSVDPGASGVDRVLQAIADAQSVGSLPAALEAEPVDAATVRELLIPPDGGLLVFVPAPDASHVLALDRDGALHRRLADVRDLRPLCEELDLLVRSSPATLPDDQARLRRRGELERRARALALELWPPEIAQRLAGWSCVSLVAVDLVGQLPLEALPLPGGRPLGTALAVANLPGLAVGAALARRHPLSPAELDFDHDLVLLGQVQIDPRALARFGDLPPLPIDAGWIDAWTRPFDPARVERLLGPAATLPELERACAGSVRMLQLFVHGVRDPGREVSAGLLLGATPASDGVLWSEGVKALEAPPLVVLSACGAGHGPERSGDPGSSDLGGAFLSAGADAVILAASDTAFHATALLDRELHASLARGAPVAEALRAARSALLAESGLDDPYYFATMRVVGLGHRAVFPARSSAPSKPQADPPRSRRLIAGGAALLLGAGALLVLRIKGRKVA